MQVWLGSTSGFWHRAQLAPDSQGETAGNRAGVATGAATLSGRSRGSPRQDRPRLPAVHLIATTEFSQGQSVQLPCRGESEERTGVVQVGERSKGDDGR